MVFLGKLSKFSGVLGLGMTVIVIAKRIKVKLIKNQSGEPQTNKLQQFIVVVKIY